MTRNSLVIIIFIFVIQIISIAQTDIQDYKIPKETKGSSIIFGLNGAYSGFNDNSTGNKNSNGNLQGNLSASFWKIKDKFSYGVFSSGTLRFQYDASRFDDTSMSRIYRNGFLNGNLIGTIDRYFNKSNIYISGSYAYVINGDYNNSYYKDATWGVNSINVLWLSLGYGKIVNASRITKSNNFESVLKKAGVITAPLSKTLKNKLTEMFDKRNAGDYTSKYKDDKDAVFFRDVENLLMKENAISGKLGAETVMLLYRSLTDPKFIYYPRYKGWQTQIEAQYNPSGYTYQNNFVTLSGIYGQPFGEKTGLVFSAFASVPLNNQAADNNLFISSIRNPFTGYLPVLADQYGMENYSYNFYGSAYMNPYYRDLSYVTGIKFHAFHSFSANIGALIYAQGICAKPKQTGFRNSEILGCQIDFNVISFLNITAGFSYLKNNIGTGNIYSSIGTSFIIL